MDVYENLEYVFHLPTGRRGVYIHGPTPWVRFSDHEFAYILDFNEIQKLTPLEKALL